MSNQTPEPSMALLKWLSIGFAVITVLITLAFFSWWAMREHFVFGDNRFDPVRWMAPAAAQKATCERGDMVKDVRSRLLRAGMDKREVTMLLGRPDWEEAQQIEYELGVCQWIVHGFRLYFDAQDRLTHTGIIQH